MNSRQENELDTAEKKTLTAAKIIVSNIFNNTSYPRFSPWPGWQFQTRFQTLEIIHCFLSHPCFYHNDLKRPRKMFLSMFFFDIYIIPSRKFEDKIWYFHVFFISRFAPYSQFNKCKICKSHVHQAGSNYCQGEHLFLPHLFTLFSTELSSYPVVSQRAVARPTGAFFQSKTISEIFGLFLQQLGSSHF